MFFIHKKKDKFTLKINVQYNIFKFLRFCLITTYVLTMISYRTLYTTFMHFLSPLSAFQEGVKIFFEETIYHLGDRYVEYLKDYKKKKQDEFKHVAVFPSRLKIIPTVSWFRQDA